MPVHAFSMLPPAYLQIGLKVAACGFEAIAEDCHVTLEDRDTFSLWRLHLVDSLSLWRLHVLEHK